VDHIITMAEKQKRAKLREEVKEIKEAAKQPGSLIHELELDDWNLNFSLGDDGVSGTLFLPETWPNGIYKVLDHHGMREIGRGLLRHMLDKIIVAYAQDVGKEPIPRFPGLVEAPEADALSKQASQLDIGEDFVPTGSGLDLQKAMPVMDAVRKVKAVFGDRSAGVMIVGGGDHILRFRIDTSFIDADTAKIWGVHYNVPIIIEIKLIAPHFLQSSKRPDTEIYQCATTDLSMNLNAEKLKFTLSWQLEQRLRENLTWPIKGDPGEFFCQLLLFMQDKVKHATKYCMICDKTLEYVGLKPAVCNSPLCEYSHTQYGLGEDVSQFMHHNPEVVDMLVCLTGAAATGDLKRFNPFPNGVEAKIAKGKGQFETVGFMTGEKMDQKNGTFVHEVIQMIPAMKKLLEYSSSTDLKEYLDTIHPLCFPLLRWIITSNRVHLELVPKEKQMKEITTPYQFVLRSSTPEKEKKFVAERAKQGSFFAFHGSALSNWHCILRIGLKNYSNTEFMSCGAAYGQGIYMAPNSSTSFGYSGSGISPWKNSEICQTSTTCLALCEVINAGYTPNPHYVVPQEDHVNTRFFFLFSGSGSVSVDASSLSVPDLSATSRADAPATEAPKKPGKRK